jgi:hypothetical protein
MVHAESRYVMSNEWSGDGGFSKGYDQTREYPDGTTRGRHDHTGYAGDHSQGMNIDWEAERARNQTGTPEYEWSTGERPTYVYDEPAPAPRVVGAGLPNPWPLVKKLVGYAVVIFLVVCILAFVAGAISGAAQVIFS